MSVLSSVIRVGARRSLYPRFVVIRVPAHTSQPPRICRSHSLTMPARCLLRIRSAASFEIVITLKNNKFWLRHFLLFCSHKKDERAGLLTIELLIMSKLSTFFKQMSTFMRVDFVKILQTCVRHIRLIEICNTIF